MSNIKYIYNDEVRDSIINAGNTKDITITNCIFQNTLGCIYANPSGSAMIARNVFTKSHSQGVVDIRSRSIVTFSSNCILHCIGQGKGDDLGHYGSLVLLKSDEIVGYSFNFAFGNKDADASKWIEYINATKVDISSSNISQCKSSDCSGPLITSGKNGSARYLLMESSSSSIQFELYKCKEGFSATCLIFSKGVSGSNEFRIFDTDMINVSECVFFQSKRSYDFKIEYSHDVKISKCSFSRKSASITQNESYKIETDQCSYNLDSTSNFNPYVPNKCSAKYGNAFDKVYIHIICIPSFIINNQ